MIVSLSGFMGCGKSTVGRMLIALRPEYSLIDLDNYIEQSSGRGIPEIFAADGEAAFREMEAEALEDIFLENRDRDVILSLGGGTLMTPRCAALVTARSTNIYLRASEDFLVENLLLTGTEGRPMLSGTSDEAALRARIRELLSQRESTYMACAAHIVTLDGKDYFQIRDCVAALLKD